MEISFIAILMFICLVLIIELLFFSIRTLRAPREKIRQRLRKYAQFYDKSASQTDILRKRVLSDIPLLDKVLLVIPGLYPLEVLIKQANSQHPIGFYILFSILLGITGFWGTAFLMRNITLQVIVGFIWAYLPILKLQHQKKRRLAKFQEQLPEALDLIARAMRAGHAFSTGLRLVSKEFDDPIGPEFDAVLEEINFGLSVSDALKNLGERVESPDLRYFIVCVLLQRETGGNLSELLNSLAFLIRERFKLRGKIRTLSAEGRMSAWLLVMLPFCLGVFLYYANPEFLGLLFTKTAGRKMLFVGMGLMAAGTLVMRKMINFRV